MTNFEKWKQSLTPEEVFHEYGMFEGCKKACPATEHCKEHKNVYHQIIWSKAYWDCRNFFLAWANNEAE